MSPVDTSRIAPRLYIGGQHHRHGLSRMKKLGISASLSLRENVDDNDRGVALEQHLWLPTVDNTPPTLEELAQAAGFIRQAIEAGRGVYVHCASGVGRAPTTAAAYLVADGMTPDQAWAFIRKTRPFIRPRDGQVQQLEKFHQSGMR
jgi:protein-tyrosine phosphatase